MAAEPLDFPASWPVGTKTGVYPIPLIKTTIAGFVGRTERGPVNEAVAVRSFAEYCRIFGAHSSAGSVSYAVQDFFLHGGGKAVVVRVCNRATRARIELPAGGECLHLQARYPGRQEILRVSVDYEQVEDDPACFNLVVQRLRSSGSQLIGDQELYPCVSLRPDHDRFLVDVLKDSRLVGLTGPVPACRPDATPPDRPGAPIKYVAMTTPGEDGDELTDYDIIGSNRDGTGLFAFERGPRIDLLCIPLAQNRDLGMTAFLAAERFCEQTRAILIWDPPWSWDSADSAAMGARRLDCASRNVMTYFPRIRPRGERVRFKLGLPACGAIAGMLAQHDRHGIWQRAAPTDFILKASFTPVLDLDASAASQLGRAGINCFVRSSGGTTRLTGNVTVGRAGFSSRLWRRLDRRRLSLFILRSVEEAAEWAAQNFRTRETLQRFEAQVGNFLTALHEQGALAGKTPAQSYFGEGRMRPGVDDAFELRFGFALERPGEFAGFQIAIEPERAGRIVPLPALEAEQFFN